MCNCASLSSDNISVCAVKWKQGLKETQDHENYFDVNVVTSPKLNATLFIRFSSKLGLE